jgi:Bacterial extracellular solute-binding protein
MEASGDSPRSPAPGIRGPAPSGVPEPVLAPTGQEPSGQGPRERPPEPEKGPPRGSGGAGKAPGSQGGDGQAGKEPLLRRVARDNLSTILTTLTTTLVVTVIADYQHDGKFILLAMAILLGVSSAAYAFSFVIPAIPALRAEWRRRRERRAARRATAPGGPDPAPARPPDEKPVGRQVSRLILGGVLAAVSVTVIMFLIGFWVIGGGFARGPLPGAGGLLGIALVGAALTWWVLRGRERAPGAQNSPRWRKFSSARARLRSWASSRRNSALLACAVALGLATGGGLGATDLASPAVAATCPPPAELRVLASSEILGALQAAIPVFEQDERTELSQPCYAVDLTAYAAPTDTAADNGLASGWNLAADGPHPDIWIPASSAEVAKAVQGASAPVLRVLGSVASSPIVVAVPSALAGRSLKASAHGISLGGLYQALSAAGIDLRVPSPLLSETGLLGVTGLYQALAGSGTAAQRIEHAGGLQSDTDGGSTLCAAAQAALSSAQQRATSQQAAYLVSEAAMTASNANRLTAPACAMLPAAPPALTAFYPADGTSLDFPFTTVTWGGGPSSAAPGPADGTTARAGDVRALYTWLRSQAGLRVLAAQGLRKPQATRLPSPAATAAALTEFTQGQPPAHVLIAIDDSGPMRPYLTQIASDVNEVLGPQAPGGSAGDQNSFAIWEFPGAHGDTSKVLVPYGAATRAQRGRVPGGLADLTAQGHSAQFNMLAQAVPYLVRAAGSQSVSTVVMFTDGDSYSPTDPGGSFHSFSNVTELYRVAMPGGAPLRVFVIAFGPPGCGESASGQAAQSLTALAAATGGTCWNAATTDPGQVLGQLWAAG